MRTRIAPAPRQSGSVSVDVPVVVLLSRWLLVAACLSTGNVLHAQAMGGGRNPLGPFLFSDTTVFAIRDVRVIDGTGAPARAHQTLVIRDGVIAAVGDTERVDVPPDALVIDGAGKSVMPGLVMLHEHFFLPTGSIGSWFGESGVRLFLAAGVTSIRTSGDVNGYATIALKQQIDRGMKPGPWIDAAAPFLQGQGGPPMAAYALTSADDARRYVDFWADAGATSFKAYTHITRDQLAAAIERAHARGLKVTLHSCSVTFREAVELGIDNLEHGFFTLTDFVASKEPDVCPSFFNPGGRSIVSADTASEEFRSLIRLLVDRHVALTSTLPVFESAIPTRPMPPGTEVLAPQLRELADSVYRLRQQYPPSAFAELYPKAAALEVAFVRAGGVLLAGSDAGSGQGSVVPGFANQRELELLVEAGLTPLEALKIGTLNGATYLNRSETIGSIAVGKQADLVLVDGDPSVQIADVRNVVIVFKVGRAFDPVKLIDSVRGWVGIY